MSKIILVIILMTFVYSWDEIKYFLLRLIFPNLNRYKNSSDKFVADAILFATIPLTLCLYLTSDASFTKKLFLSVLQLAGVWILIRIISHVRDRASDLPFIETISASTYFLPKQNHLLATPFQLSDFNRLEFASKFILRLIAATVLGLLFVFLNSNFNPPQLNDNYIILICIGVGAGIVWLTIKNLESFLHHRHVRIGAAVRIFTGILISALLLVSK